ncbi:MAG: TRAP transporter small permease [Rhodospirillaceae bacterium]|nr:TRAP transporter small permease [Rhodospirillaceae bacterium]
MPARQPVRALVRFEETLSKILLATTTVLVVAASLARWAGHPIIWSVDIAQFLFVWLSFLGANQALRTNHHIGVDIITRRLPREARRWLYIVLWLIIAAFLIAIAYYGTELTLSNLERRLSDTDLSYGLVTSAVPVGCALLLITTLAKLVAIIRDGPEAVETPSEPSEAS